MVDGKRQRIFGWDVSSHHPSYAAFLKQFLPALITHLDQLGIKENCYFHISDEPVKGDNRLDYVNYKAAKELVKPLLEGCKIMDALSHVDFFDNGLIDYPVPCHRSYRALPGAPQEGALVLLLLQPGQAGVQPLHGHALLPHPCVGPAAVYE